MIPGNTPKTPTSSQAGISCGLGSTGNSDLGVGFTLGRLGIFGLDHGLAIGGGEFERDAGLADGAHGSDDLEVHGLTLGGELTVDLEGLGGDVDDAAVAGGGLLGGGAGGSHADQEGETVGGLGFGGFGHVGFYNISRKGVPRTAQMDGPGDWIRRRGTPSWT